MRMLRFMERRPAERSLNGTGCWKGAVTERDRLEGGRRRGVDRVVDRPVARACAVWAFCAFGRAVCAGRALRAAERAYGKEKVYGSIP